MYCENCGTKLDDSMKFCTKCGMKCDSHTKQVQEYMSEQLSKKSGKEKRNIVLLLVCVFVAILSVVLFLKKDKLNLKNGEKEVYLCVEKNTWTKGKIGDTESLEGRVRYEYDEYGNLITEKIDGDWHNFMIGLNEYIYDEDGKLIKSICETVDEQLEQEFYDERDDEWELAVISNDNDRRESFFCVDAVTIYTYDEKGNIIYKKVTNSAGILEDFLTYDSEERVVQSVTKLNGELYTTVEYSYEKDSKISVTYTPDGQWITRIREAYGADGELLESEYSYSEDWTMFPSGKCQYIYSDGKIVEAIYSDEKGGYTVESRIYDQNGNCTEIWQKSKEGDIEYVTTQVYELFEVKKYEKNVVDTEVLPESEENEIEGLSENGDLEGAVGEEWKQSSETIDATKGVSFNSFEISGELEIEGDEQKEETVYQADNLPNGFFVKDGEWFYPLDVSLPDDYHYETYGDSSWIWTEGVDYSDTDFVKLKAGTTIAYKGDFSDTSESIYLQEIKHYGYTLNVVEDIQMSSVGLYSIDGEKICTTVKYVNDDEVSYGLKQYASEHRWTTAGGGSVFYNNFQLNDEFHLGYFEGTEYHEYIAKADKWAVAMGEADFPWEDWFYLKPTKNGYFEVSLDGIPKSGLYRLDTLNYNYSRQMLLWIE